MTNAIQLETAIVCMTLVQKMVVVACINNVMYGYNIKGTKQFSLYFKNRITALQHIPGPHGRDVHVIILMSMFSCVFLCEHWKYFIHYISFCFVIAFCLPFLYILCCKLHNLNVHKLICAAFDNGEIRLYNENMHIHTLTLDPVPITALRYGAYGREEACLIVINDMGTLFVKMLSRTANLTVC